VSRAPSTLSAAKAALERTDVTPDTWRTSADGRTRYWSQQLELGQGAERWCIVRTTAGEERAWATLSRHLQKDEASWIKRLWHLGNRPFACEADARAALAAELKGLPASLRVQADVRVEPRYAQPGRPPKDAVPLGQEYFLTATLTRDSAQFERAVQRAASFIVATNVLEQERLADEELIAVYKDQHSVERGFAFLKDPLFLATSVFLKNPERIVALSLIMVLCLLIYRLAEHRLRKQLAATGQTIPDQLNKPTTRPTMRWVFQCFEGIDLLQIRHGPRHAIRLVLRLEPLHQQILALPGPSCRQLYESRH
jgi:transposase